MVIKNEKYQIIVNRDSTFTLDSTDNKPYELILNPCNLKRNDNYTGFSLTIDNGINARQFILVGSMYGTDEDVAVIVNDNLFVLMNTVIVSIDCNTIAVKLQKELPNFGIYFSIYKFENGYIIYGEMDILKLSSDFDIEWTFSGADIFVSLDGSIPFYVDNNIIFLTDWNGTKYKVDKYGKMIL